MSKNKVKVVRALISFGVGAFLIVGHLSAASVGKIMGVVRDPNGEPIEAAAVSIPQLKTGCYTDEDGSFFILNVPTGTYTLEVHFLGYNPVKIENIKVEPDKTTFVEVTLKPQAIEMEEVVVRAESPDFDKYATWKETSLDIREKSAFKDIAPEAILKAVSGFTQDAGGEWHLRGGRSDDVVFYVDAMPVTDPLRGGSATELDPWALNQLAVFAGSFSANYGAALSGIVTATTWEPSKRGINLAISLKSPYLYGLSLNSPYQRKDAFAPDAYDLHRDSLDNSLYEPPKLNFAENLSLKLRAGYRAHSWFAGFTFADENTPSYLPFGYSKYRSINGKFGIQTGSFRLDVPFEVSNSESKGYSHRWKYHPEGYPTRWGEFTRISANASGLLTQSVSWKITIGFKKHKSFLGFDEDSLPWTYEPPRSDEQAEFYIGGQAPVYRKDLSQTIYGHYESLLQVGHHELRAGVELQKHHFEVHEWERFYIFGYLGEGHMSEYDVSPLQFAAYVQDKIEYPGFFLNIGLRAEGQNLGVSFWKDIESPGSELTRVPTKIYIAPRIGLAYPVTDKIVFHLAYGHFLRTPPMDAMFRNFQFRDHPEDMPQALVVIGNPFLKPERTVSYEVGIRLLAGEFNFDISLFAKDVWDLLSTRRIVKFPYDYNYYNNGDFATIRGFEVDARGSVQNIRWQFSYMYQVALGNRSFPLRAFYDAYTGMPEAVKEYPLDYDRRHTVKAMVEADLLGLHWLNIVDFATGLPYTPDLGTGVVAPPNSARMPPTLDWILKVEKTVKNVTFSLEVYNLLNYLNVRAVHPRTGDPFDPGPIERAWSSPDTAHNPAHVGPPRRWRFGIRWEL